MLKKLLSSKRNIFGVQIADWLLVLLAIAVYGAITLATITKFSIWFDEAFSDYIIHFNFIDIARYTATDVHPPLYYWLLKIWSSIFGHSILGIRSMSVVFGGIAIVFGYLLAHRYFGKKVANVSLIFMAISPMLVRYGQEARMYTLVLTIALAATYVLAIAMESKKRWPWVVYGILVSLGMWTHYFTAIVWLAHWVWRADVIRRDSKKGEFIKKFFSKPWLKAHALAVALYLPWLPLMAMQVLIVQAFGFWVPPVTPNTIINYFTNVLYYTDSVNITGWLTLGLIVLIGLLIFLGKRVYKAQNQKQRRAYRLIMAIAFAPIALLCLVSMPPLRSSFVDRYLVTSAFGIALFIGVTFGAGYDFLKRRGRYIITIFAACLMLFGVTTVWTIGNYNKNTGQSNNTRDIIQAVDTKSKTGEPIIAATPWFFYEATFYSTDSNPVYFIEPSSYDFGSLDMLKYNDNHKIKRNDLAAFTKQHPTIWYVGYSNDNSLAAPYSNWSKIREIKINDTINNKPAYAAIEYKTTVK